MPDLAVAVGRAVVLVGLDASWRSHKGNVRLGCVHSTVTALEFSFLPSLGVSLLAACYGAVSVWGAAALQGGVSLSASGATLAVGGRQLVQVFDVHSGAT